MALVSGLRQPLPLKRVLTSTTPRLPVYKSLFGIINSCLSPAMLRWYPSPNPKTHVESLKLVQFQRLLRQSKPLAPSNISGEHNKPRFRVCKGQRLFTHTTFPLDISCSLKYMNPRLLKVESLTLPRWRRSGISSKSMALLQWPSGMVPVLDQT